MWPTLAPRKVNLTASREGRDAPGNHRPRSGADDKSSTRPADRSAARRLSVEITRRHHDELGRVDVLAERGVYGIRS